MKRGLTIIEGIVLVVIVAVLVAIFYPVFKRPGHRHQPSCMSNQRQLALAAIMWSNENKKKLPEALGWAKTLQLEGKLLWCPTQGKKKSGGNSYGYNFAAGGKKLDDLKNPTVVVMTADCLNTLADRVLRTPADLDPRHNGKVVCSFVDGHVELTKVPEKLIMPSSVQKKGKK